MLLRIRFCTTSLWMPGDICVIYQTDEASKQSACCRRRIEAVGRALGGGGFERVVVFMAASPDGEKKVR